MLLLAGENDDICPAEPLRALGDRIGDARVVIAEGTDHYFWRREREAGEIVAGFAEEVLFPSGAPAPDGPR